MLHETPAGRAGVEELLAHVGDVDLVLVEGFKNEGDYPKYEVFRPDATPEGPLFPGALLAGVVSNVSAEALGTDLPVLPIDEPERVAAHMFETHLRR